MKVLQCMTCGWADLALSEDDAEMKSQAHSVKTGCIGEVRRGS